MISEQAIGLRIEERSPLSRHRPGIIQVSVDQLTDEADVYRIDMVRSHT